MDRMEFTEDPRIAATARFLYFASLANFDRPLSKNEAARKDTVIAEFTKILATYDNMLRIEHGRQLANAPNEAREEVVHA